MIVSDRLGLLTRAGKCRRNVICFHLTLLFIDLVRKQSQCYRRFLERGHFIDRLSSWGSSHSVGEVRRSRRSLSRMVASMTARSGGSEGQAPVKNNSPLHGGNSWEIVQLMRPTDISGYLPLTRSENLTFSTMNRASWTAKHFETSLPEFENFSFAGVRSCDGFRSGCENGRVEKERNMAPAPLIHQTS